MSGDRAHIVSRRTARPAVTMAPRHLLALCLAVVTLHHAKSTKYTSSGFQNQTTVPDFWWDLTLNHNAYISSVLIQFPNLKDTSRPEMGLQFGWDLGWAQGTTSVWDAGQRARWTAWTWESNGDSEISGGGFLFNKTGKETALAGVCWLRDGHSDTITWNCFAEGNLTTPLPWDSWQMNFNENGNRTIGFVKEETRWGFYVDSDLVLSKHCADGGVSVAGKRFKFLHGKEIQKSVSDDPFKITTFSRQKRSPDFFEKVGQKLKEWVEKAKKFLGIGQQQADGQGDQDGLDGQEGKDGSQRCNSFLDVLVRIINLIFRRQGTPSSPPGGNLPPGGGGGVPPQNDAGGDPPGGANVPPADAEELDPSQNDAIRDWE